MDNNEKIKVALVALTAGYFVGKSREVVKRVVLRRKADEIISRANWKIDTLQKTIDAMIDEDIPVEEALRMHNETVTFYNMMNAEF